MAELDKQNMEESEGANGSFDYSYVPTVARVAVYDDMKMAPRIIDIDPAPTAEYIEKLADVIDEQKRRLGGKIPYSAIREVSENFIHARFTEVVVSILDGGNTIRFCDQGPGIKDKEKATLPGFTSAIEPMKHYIRGVGSGLPLVKEYLDLSHGKITIEDNLNTGAVVTISLEQNPTPEPQVKAPSSAQMPTPGQVPYAGFPQGSAPAPQTAPVQQPYYPPAAPAPVPSQSSRSRHNVPMPPLSEREITALVAFANEGALGVTELANIMQTPMSSTYNVMNKLEESALIERTNGKKRILTDYGYAVFQQLNTY